MGDYFTSAFVRRLDRKGKPWQGVLKYQVPNPDYVPDTRADNQRRKSMGKRLNPEYVPDTRTAKQRKPNISKQVSKVFSSKVRTKSQANAALEVWRVSMEAGMNAPKATNILLLDYIEEYVSTREAAQIIEKSTAADYRHTAKRLEGTFSGVALADLTPSQVQRWEASELKRGVSPTTVGKTHRLLKQVLKYAFTHEVVDRNIMDVVEPPKRTKKNPNGLTIEEAQRVTAILMEAGPTPVSTAAFLALHASLRAGECCGLRWEDVDLDANRLYVKRAVGLAAGGAYIKSAKTNGSIRTVDLDPDTVAMLADRQAVMHAELKRASIVMSAEAFSKLYVCGTIEGVYLNPQILSRKWSAIAEERHITGTEGKRATFHTLRHGFATVAIATNSDIASVAAQMGHSNITQTLNTYTSALESGKREVAANVGRAMHPTGHQATVTQMKPTGTNN